MAELCAARDAASGADLVELRLDYVDRPDVARALDGRTRPVLVTCRAAWEGGRYAGTEDDRRQLLIDAVRAGAEQVDVEAAAPCAAEIVAITGGRGIVVSHHDFSGPGGHLPDTYRRLRSLGAETVKIAVSAASLAETLPIFDLGQSLPAAESRVLLAMGPAGWPTRILAGRLGNRWTYAGDGVAPGQMAASRLLRDFRFRRIRPDAALYAVVGRPVGHSRSPQMHNAGFAALGLNAVYLPLEAADAADFVTFARALGLRGASITAPFKVDLLGMVDEVEPLALRAGAINTLIVRGSRWIGANTDIEGFLAPLDGRLPLEGARTTVLGAGGAARGVAVALHSRGARITVLARRPAAADPIAALVDGQAGGLPPAAGSWDLLVNATSAGRDGVDPAAGATLDGRLVYDLVYAAGDTPLLAAARAAGLEVVGGLAMLVAQAERQFEQWTGQRPPAGLFAAAVEPSARDQPTPRHDAAETV